MFLFKSGLFGSGLLSSDGVCAFGIKPHCVLTLAFGLFLLESRLIESGLFESGLFESGHLLLLQDLQARFFAQAYFFALACFLGDASRCQRFGLALRFFAQALLVLRPGQSGLNVGAHCRRWIIIVRRRSLLNRRNGRRFAYGTGRHQAVRQLLDNSLLWGFGRRHVGHDLNGRLNRRRRFGHGLNRAGRKGAQVDDLTLGRGRNGLRRGGNIERRRKARLRSFDRRRSGYRRRDCGRGGHRLGGKGLRHAGGMRRQDAAMVRGIDLGWRRLAFAGILDGTDQQRRCVAGGIFRRQEEIFFGGAAADQRGQHVGLAVEFR